MRSLVRLCAVALLAITWPAIPQPIKPSGAIVLASYNILADKSVEAWKHRSPTINQFLASQSPDIVALQEVTEHQMGDIARANPKFSYFVGERSDGTRGDQGWYEYNPILFDRDRFELVMASSFWVSETPTVPGSILARTKKHARVFTWAQLRDRVSGALVLVGNVHIHGLRGDDEIKIIMDQISNLNFRGSVVILGDFNATSDGNAYAWISQHGKWFSDAASGSQDENASTLIGPEGVTIEGAGASTRLRAVKDARRIDYIFTCGFSRRITYHVVDNRVENSLIFASDHKPILAAFGPDFVSEANCLAKHPD
jgi:endonuclease/exonuclease/phosphatase family metal-dependent hydrolase